MPVYRIDVKLPNGVTVTNVVVMESEIDNQGIDLLIGMDIISLGDFSVTSEIAGGSRRTCFSFRIPPVETIDYVKQWNDEKSKNGEKI